MATSVVLKACGGLGPYTWEKTGNITLSATTGTHVTVSVNAQSGVPAVFYLTFTTAATACSGGNCSGYPLNLGGAPNFVIRTTDCSGADTGNCSVTNPNLVPTPANCESGTDSTNISCAPDCTGTLDILCAGCNLPLGTPPCSMAGLADSITLTCGSATGTLEHADYILGRNEYLIIDGSNPASGATVTVTDSAGVSTTYAF
jgi:hypothetical protein